MTSKGQLQIDRDYWKAETVRLDQMIAALSNDLKDERDALKAAENALSDQSREYINLKRWADAAETALLKARAEWDIKLERFTLPTNDKIYSVDEYEELREVTYAQGELAGLQLAIKGLKLDYGPQPLKRDLEVAIRVREERAQAERDDYTEKRISGLTGKPKLAAGGYVAHLASDPATAGSPYASSQVIINPKTADPGQINFAPEVIKKLAKSTSDGIKEEWEVENDCE